MKRNLILHLLGLASLLLYYFGFSSMPSTINNTYIIHLGLFTAALFALYGLLLWLARKWSLCCKSRSSIHTIIIYALAVRVLLLLANPEITPLSDDVYRYVWEGKLVSAGYNPYVISPEMMQTSGLADSVIYPKINHPNLPTIYPPLAQFLFATAWVAGGDSLTGYRTLSFLFELAALFLILVMIREYQLPEWTSLIYAFSPLVLIEFGFSSHVDMLGLPFLITAIIFLRRKNPFAVGIFLALAVLIKLLAVIFLPLLLIHFGGRKKIILLVGFISISLLAYLPFLLSAGPGLFGSLWIYLGQWEHNGSLFSLIQSISNSAIARVITGGLFLGATYLIVLRTKRPGRMYSSRYLQPTRAMHWTIVSFLLLSATVYPWYLVWLLPFLVLYRDTAILIFTGTVFLSYYALIQKYDNGAVALDSIMLVLEYLPVFALLLWGTFGKRIRTSTPVVR